MATQKEHKRSFSDRLEEEFRNSGYNKSSLAKKLNVTHTTVSRWLDGQIPRGEALNGLASLMNVNVQWLLTEEGPKEPVNKEAVEKLQSNVSIVSEELVEIPVLSWAHAGQAMCYDEMPSDYMEPIAIPKKMLNGYRACGLIVDGDSMEPVIEHGDRIAVLQGAEPKNGCLVVAKFKHDEGVMVRRYQVLSAPKGKPDKVKLIPYNSMYAATEHHISEFAWIMPVAAMMRHFW